MSLLLPNKIELEYTPAITIEKLKSAIAKHLPNYKHVNPFLQLGINKLRYGDGFAVKRRGSTAIALVFLKHNERANSTTIRIWTTFRIGGLLLLIATKKDSLERVEEAIRMELPNMIRG
ncbi:MAG: hypothetical protein IJK22_02875 [Bacteroidales bacterium]|nr:hypothetical protein [Bacteroidales bacterium]